MQYTTKARQHGTRQDKTIQSASKPRYDKAIRQYYTTQGMACKDKTRPRLDDQRDKTTKMREKTRQYITLPDKKKKNISRTYKTTQDKTRRIHHTTKQDKTRQDNTIPHNAIQGTTIDLNDKTNQDTQIIYIHNQARHNNTRPHSTKTR